MREEKTYTLEQIRNLLANLDNEISIPEPDMSGKESNMPKRMKEVVTVNGRNCWITGYTFQDMCDNYVKLLIEEGLLEWAEDDVDIPFFGEYLDTFYETFKQNQESNTVINRDRIVKNHIRPAFGLKRIDKISISELQRWINRLGEKYSRETILKIKNIMSPVFDAAVEDGLIKQNPLKSKRLEIGGKETVHHKAIPKYKMKEIKNTAPMINGKERYMIGLLCYTGMRFEEVLGVRWEDRDDDWIEVKRAVVHPTRNLPEIKLPKTKSSERQIPIPPQLKELLSSDRTTGFIIASDKDPTGETPLSYSEARRLFDKIRKRFRIEEYSAHDFRDTCATEWRENGMPLDLIARILGHSKSETTEQRYVKYRSEILDEVKAMM